ncbi:MAG TPA: CBS domain-containing protein [Thermoplasmata archaeon]|nr:CBS domain-containing protein [Thermoplasmata archaeon]
MVLTARDIMDSQVVTVDGELDVLSCSRLLTERHKGYAVVLGRQKELGGIVTEWDFLSKVVAVGANATTLRVREIATPIVRSCTPETPAEDVVELMVKEGIRRIVVQSGTQVVGIITSRDVLAMFRQYVDKLSAQIAGYHSDPAPMG